MSQVPLLCSIAEDLNDSVVMQPARRTMIEWAQGASVLS